MKQNYKRNIYIPIILIESKVFRSLTPVSKTILIELLAQFKGENNGNLSASHSMAKTWGVKSKATLFKALKELINKGLVIKTRQGDLVKGLYTLYAISWLPINNNQLASPYRTIKQIIENFNGG